jgi:hypothetical protein
VQNSGKERKAQTMAAFSTIGIILMVCAGILFAYQVMSAFLGMGASDDFVYENIRLEEVVGESTLNWIDSISSPSIQGFAETVISIPLVVLLLSGAIVAFIIYMFRGHK